MCIKSDFEEIILKLATYGKEKKPSGLSVPARGIYIIELPHDKTNKMACAPSEDSDQPVHPHGLIRVFTVWSMGS